MIFSVEEDGVKIYMLCRVKLGCRLAPSVGLLRMCVCGKRERGGCGWVHRQTDVFLVALRVRWKKVAERLPSKVRTARGWPGGGVVGVALPVVFQN